ncbi:MAG: hypothetical protein N2Z65_02350 [Clostridiales bacterium]|nr:hypothetical protein [Clostridiales bacterium]
MGIMLIVSLGLFAIVLCIVEVPKMLNAKEYKEMIVFFVILCFGVIVAILKILGVHLINPQDIVTFIYSPIIEAFKSVLEK